MCRICCPDHDFPLVLPDLLIPRKVASATNNSRFPDQVNADGTARPRVAIIARDPLAMAGMCHMLAQSAPDCVCTYSFIPDIGMLVEHDIVIWIRVHHDGMPDLAGHVAWLCRKSPGVRQLVISDSLPGGIPAGPGPLSGVWLARGSESREMLFALLRLVMQSPRPSGPVLTKRLGRMQWRVLLMRARGADTSTIADSCGISVKTVSVHESTLRERLGINRRSEYAWLLRSVIQMQKVVPALRRNVSQLNKKEKT